MSDPNESRIGFENLPNVYFKNIRTRIETNNENFIVSGHMRVFDGINDKYWSDDEFLGGGFLKIKLSLTGQKESGEYIHTKIVEEDLAVEGKSLIPFNIEISKDWQKNLTISAYLYMDLNSFGNADFDWTDNKWYRGPTTEEIIFNQMNRVLTMFRLLKAGQILPNSYYGPVHVHSPIPATEIGETTLVNPTIMEGSFHRDPTTGRRRGFHSSLRREDEFNLKNYYIRDDFETINTELGQAVLRLPQPAMYLENFDVAGPQDASVYFNLHISNSILCSRTKVGSRLFRVNPEFFSQFEKKIKIKSIKINRIRSLAGAGISSSGLEERLIIQGTYPNRNRQQKKSIDGQLRAKIEKLTSFFHKDIESYQVWDYDVSVISNEIFRYSAEVEYESLLDQHLKDKMNHVLAIVSQIETYQDSIYRNPAFYDDENLTLTKEGYIRINKEFGYNIIEDENLNLVRRPDQRIEDTALQNQAYWLTAPQAYSDLLEFLTPDFNFQSYTTIFNYLNPIGASLETMEMARDVLKSLVNIVKNFYEMSLDSLTLSNDVMRESGYNSILYTDKYTSYQIVEHPSYYGSSPEAQYGYVDAEDRQIGNESLLNNLNNLETLDPTFDRPELPDMSTPTTPEDPQDPLSGVDITTDPDEQYGSQNPVSLNNTGPLLTPIFAQVADTKFKIGSKSLDATLASTGMTSGFSLSTVQSNLIESKKQEFESLDVREYVGENSFFARGGDRVIERIVKIKPEVVDNSVALFNLSIFSDREVSLSSAGSSQLANLELSRQIYDEIYNTVKVSYLSEFEKSQSGLYDISRPVYKPLTAQIIGQSKGDLICKTEFVNSLRNSNIRSQEVDKKNIVNSVFIVKE